MSADDANSAAELATVIDIELLVQSANQRNSLFSKFSRVFNILRYYRTSQLAQRALSTVLPAGRSRRIHHNLHATDLSVCELAATRVREISASRSVRSAGSTANLSSNLAQGKLTLLGQTLELGTPLDWQARVSPRPAHLWRFHLHYHEFLLNLGIGSGQENVDVWPLLWQTIGSWIEAHPHELADRTSDAWHPYCISRRLPAWAQLIALSDPPDDLYATVIESFVTQAEVLSQSLEHDLGGNHLLENLFALTVAGSFLQSNRSGDWFDIAAEQLAQQLELQILPHGEHYERAPMYHCQVLGNLLQTAILTRGVRDDLHELCRSSATPMLAFLRSLLHPDGEIPLFGDSCWGEAHSVSEIEAWAKLAGLDKDAEPECSSIVHGPYWISRKDRDALICDTGPVGENTLPAHAHCDLLGFEASIEGARWFVDSGLYDYEDSPMRAYCRSSAAHNVVTVGYLNSCDVWSKFRMGRRGRPHSYEHGKQDLFSWCLAGHDGYRHLRIPHLSRLMVTHPTGVWICLEAASTASNQPLVGRLHLAPEVNVQIIDDRRIILTHGETKRWLSATPDTQLELSEGWYCKSFGQRIRSQIIAYHPVQSNNNFSQFGWSLSPNKQIEVEFSASSSKTALLTLQTNGSSESFRKDLLPASTS